MNVFVLLLAFLGFLTTTVVAVYAWRTGRPALVGRALRLLGIGTALYFLALSAVSISSRERVLDVGERKAFCGFYLDCHLGVAVVRVERVNIAGDERLAVTLRVSSDARAATSGLLRPHAVVVDSLGRRYMREPGLEEAIAAQGSPEFPLDREVSAGDDFVTTLVYDVPEDAGSLRLHVTEGRRIDRAIEALLIGAEESLLHAPTTHALAYSAQDDE